MDLNQRKEQFSRAYIRAVAAVAGMVVSTPEVDHDSVDLELSARSVLGRPCRPKLDIQLKSTADDILAADQLVYPLKRKNYDDLRTDDLLVPRLLVVMLLPRADSEWLNQTDERMILRHCGYWVSVAGFPATQNKTTVSISIPRSQIFNVEALQALMTKVAGKLPL